MNESDQKQWIRDNPDYYGESSLGMWELVAELLGFNTEKAEEEIFIAEGVNSYEELSEASKCSFLDAMETDHKDYVEKRAPLIFKHIEGVDHGIAMTNDERCALEDISIEEFEVLYSMDEKMYHYDVGVSTEIGMFALYVWPSGKYELSVMLYQELDAIWSKLYKSPKNPFGVSFPKATGNISRELCSSPDKYDWKAETYYDLQLKEAIIDIVKKEIARVKLLLKKADPEFDTQSFIEDIQKSED